MRKFGLYTLMALWFSLVSGFGLALGVGGAYGYIRFVGSLF